MDASMTAVDFIGPVLHAHPAGDMTARLGRVSMNSLRVAAAVPDGLSTGIVHIGLGAFHRAHQAVYTEDAIRHSGDPSWGLPPSRRDRVRLWTQCHARTASTA
jgi:hypothetical protein